MFSGTYGDERRFRAWNGTARCGRCTTGCLGRGRTRSETIIHLKHPFEHADLYTKPVAFLLQLIEFDVKFPDLLLISQFRRRIHVTIVQTRVARLLTARGLIIGVNSVLRDRLTIEDISIGSRLGKRDIRHNIVGRRSAVRDAESPA